MSSALVHCATLTPMLGDDTEDPKWRNGMRAAQAGDGRTYAALLRACVPIIRASARARGVPADHVDDAVQDVLLTVHRVRHTFDPARPFLPWLRAIARARSVDLLRRTGRQSARELNVSLDDDAHPDQAALPDDVLEGAGRASRLKAAAAGLPPGQRQAFELLGLEERSLAEVSASTGRSVVSLKVNLHRALKALRAKLDRDDGP